MAGKGPTVTLTFAGDAGPLKRTIVTVGTATSGLVKGLDGASSSVLKFGARSAAMGGAVGSALPAIGGLATGLAQAAGAGLALPGALAAGAAAMATLKVATAGFGEAMKNLGDPEAFAEAIGKLAPNARATAVAVRDLKPAFDGVQSAVQNNLFRGFADDVTALGKTYLPVLKLGMGGVAAQMNAMGREATKALLHPAAVNDVDEVFLHLSTTLYKMRGTLGNVTSGFLGLAGVGATYLPQLGASVDGVAAKFKAWVDRGVESGRINEIIDQGIAALKTLGAIAGNIGSIFSGIWSAADAGGGNFLVRVQEITGRIAELVNSAQGQEALTTFFSTLSTLAGYVQQAFALLQPHLPAIASAFSAIAVSVGGTLLTALQLVAPHFSTIAGVIQTVAPVIGPLALGILAVSKGMQAWAAIQPILTAGVKAWQVAQLALNVAMRMNPLGIVVTLIGLLVGALIYAWQNSETFRNIVTGVWEAVKTGISAAVDWIVGAIGWFANLPGMVGGWFGEMKDWAIRKAGEMVAWIRGLPGMIMSGIGNLGSLLLNAGRDLLTGLWNGISGAIGWLKSKIGSFFGSLLPGWVKDMLGIRSPSKVFAALGKFIPQGLAAGIEGGLGSVSIASAKMASAAADPLAGLGDTVRLGSVSQGTWDALKAAGWRGRAGDNMEALYRPPGSLPPAGAGGSGVEVRFTGNTSDALATVIMQMIRTGKIQIRAGV